MTTPLAPCPFCGGAWRARTGMGEYWHQCRGCGVETDMHATREQAAAAVNRRALPFGMTREQWTRIAKERAHYDCGDCWYSCPKSGECCNDAKGDECDCGADDWNALTAPLRAGLAHALEGTDD